MRIRPSQWGTRLFLVTLRSSEGSQSRRAAVDSHRKDVPSDLHVAYSVAGWIRSSARVGRRQLDSQLQGQCWRSAVLDTHSLSSSGNVLTVV
jgi:hypothetical protein